MVGKDAIREVAAQIAREFCPDRIILFGSCARGCPTPDSDVDLLVIPPLEPAWEHLRTDLDALSSLGIEARYPGLVADAEDVAEALRIARPVRTLVRRSLGLPAEQEEPGERPAPGPDATA